MRWNIGWFICVVLAGPFAYFTLEALQPNKLRVIAVLASVPALMLLVNIVRFVLTPFRR